MLQKFPINVTKVPHVTEVPFFRYKSAGSYGSLSLSLSLSLCLKYTLKTRKIHFNKNRQEGKTFCPLSRKINHQFLALKVFS